MKPGAAKNLFLTGFMGAGKSTVGKLLAEHLGTVFVDLDSVIAEQEKRSIAEIFATDGEEYFRDCETRVLRQLSAHEGHVYATGGGIVIREENRALMRSSGWIIYLSADWETLEERLRDSRDRPLVDPEQGWQAVREIWRQRQTMYMDADFTIVTDGLSPQRVATEIRSVLRQELPQ